MLPNFDITYCGAGFCDVAYSELMGVSSLQTMLDWIYQQAMSLLKLDFEHYASRSVCIVSQFLLTSTLILCYQSRVHENLMFAYTAYGTQFAYKVRANAVSFMSTIQVTVRASE